MKLLACIVMLSFMTGIAHAEFDPDLAPIQTIVLEAQGEPLEGQIAVGEVIRHRAINWHKKAVDERQFQTVCLAYKQFSCWNSPEMARFALSKTSFKAIQMAMKAWNASEESNLTHGATHYVNLSLCHPKWVDKMIKTAVIGHHTFYYEKGK